MRASIDLGRNSPQLLVRVRIDSGLDTLSPRLTTKASSCTAPPPLLPITIRTSSHLRQRKRRSDDRASSPSAPRHGRGHRNRWSLRRWPRRRRPRVRIWHTVVRLRYSPYQGTVLLDGEILRRNYGLRR